MTISTMPVPRSGCRKTSAAGARPSASIRIVWLDGRAAAGALDHERREGDDQEDLGELRGLEAEVGEPIQRREPRAAAPNISTRTIAAISE